MGSLGTRAPAAAFEREGDLLKIALSGDWRLEDPRRPSWDPPREARGARRVTAFDRGLARWDSSLALFLESAGRWCEDCGAELDLTDLPGELRDLAFQAAVAEHAHPAARRPPPPFLAQVGLAAERLAAAARDAARFVGETALGLARVPARPKTLRSADLLLYAQQAGPEGLAIIGLVAFLVGTIMAFQASLQLRKFGAEIFVVHIVTISTAREIGAIVVGVLLSGRTAAAYAAELGSMAAGEELDALETSGISPVDFLVVPRLLALLAVTPLLTVYADVLAIFGGAVVAWNMLRISPIAFWVASKQALQWTDLRMGLIKSAVFGLIIGVCGCLRGMTAARDTAGVGRAATSAVVTSILWVVIADALLGRVFALAGP
jgi:phospholipid/cholesterol/gamma-HCH transport system permease protein